MVTSSTLPHSTLGKRHNILAYHRDREAIASKILAYHWIRTGYNTATETYPKLVFFTLKEKNEGFLQPN